jgi:hypothetical protein
LVPSKIDIDSRCAQDGSGDAQFHGQDGVDNPHADGAGAEDFVVSDKLFILEAPLAQFRQYFGGFVGPTSGNIVPVPAHSVGVVVEATSSQVLEEIEQ